MVSAERGIALPLFCESRGRSSDCKSRESTVGAKAVDEEVVARLEACWLL